MRWILPTLFLLACDGPADAQLCDDLRDSQSACMPDPAYQECLDAVADCGDGVVVMESCPLQFGCR